MNQIPQIKSTFGNGVDQNPNAVENRCKKEEADRWDPRSAGWAHLSAACPLCPMGSGFFRASSRVFLNILQSVPQINIDFNLICGSIFAYFLITPCRNTVSTNSVEFCQYKPYLYDLC